MELDTMHKILFPPTQPAGNGSQILFPPTPPAGNGSQILFPPTPPAGNGSQIMFPPTPPAGNGSQILFPPTPQAGNGSFDKWPDSQFQEKCNKYLETVCQQILSLVGEMRRRGKERSATSTNVPNEYRQSTSDNCFTQDGQLNNKAHESEGPSQLTIDTEHETEIKLPSLDSNTVEDENHRSEQKDRYCLSKAIQSNFTLLVEVLPYRESELPDILGECCLTDTENSRIRNQPHREDQIRQLLRTIMGRTFRVMKHFLDYSRKFNPREVEVVWKTFEKLKREGLEEKRCVLCRMMAYVDIKYVVDILYERELVPDSFHGRVSDSVEFVGCQDTLWQELAFLCKRPRYRSSMLTALISALEKKEKYCHFGEELQRYGGHSLTSLKCTCQTNYRTGNRSSEKSKKQKRVVFCQRVESLRSSSGTTSLSPWSSNSDISMHGSSTRLQGRGRIKRLKRASSLRCRPLSQFSRREANVKPRKHKLHLNLDDKNNETKGEENESTNKYTKGHDTGFRAQTTFKSASHGTQNRLSGLSWTSELQSLDEERLIIDEFNPQTVLFKTKLEEVIPTENGHRFDANSRYHGEQEGFEDDRNADLPETFQKMLPTFLKDVRQFSGENENYILNEESDKLSERNGHRSLMRSHSNPLSPTRPSQFSHTKSVLLNDNTLSQETPAIYNSDIDDNKDKSEGAEVHSADKSDENKEFLRELEMSEDKVRKVNGGQSEKNSIFQSNVNDLLDSKNIKMRLDNGTNEKKSLCHNHITNVFDGRPKGRIIRRKRRLTTITSATSLNEDDFIETENIFDAEKQLLCKRELGANRQVCEDDICCTDEEVRVEEGDERNTLLKINTIDTDNGQYCKTYASNQHVDIHITKDSIEQNKITYKAIHKGGQAKKPVDMKNQVKDMGLKERMSLESTIERIQDTRDVVPKSLLVSESENTVSKEPLSRDQVHKVRSRSIWRIFGCFPRSKKKEKGKK